MILHLNFVILLTSGVIFASQDKRQLERPMTNFYFQETKMYEMYVIRNIFFIDYSNSALLFLYQKIVLQTMMESKQSHHLIIFDITHKSNIFKKCNVGAMTRIILYRLEINNMRNMSMNLWPNLSYDTLKPFEGKIKKLNLI